MSILFLSSKGSQYKYFKALSKRLEVGSAVKGLYPAMVVWGSWHGLSISLVRDGIAFHVARKKAKTRINLPSWCWWAYEFKSAIRFALIYMSVCSLLKKVSFQCVGVWNGHRLPEMAIKMAAARAGLKVAHFENGLIPDSTTMDFSGVNDRNSLPRKPGFYLDYFEHLNGQLFTPHADRLTPRAPHRSKLKAEKMARPEGKRFIFVPFQVGFDSQVLVNSHLVRSMGEFYELLGEALAACEDKDLIFVIKEHPSDPASYKELYFRNPRIVFSNESTEELIRCAEAVLTINSSVGLESLLLGKKVIVVGEACYKIDGLVQSVLSLKDLVSAIDRVESWSPNVMVVKGYLSYLRQVYVIKGAWQKQLSDVDPIHLAGIHQKLVENGLMPQSDPPEKAYPSEAAMLSC